MQTDTILYIIIAGVAALLLALFQYIHKSRLNTKLKYSLFTLRAISVFSILILLINPKFESFSYYNEKPILVVAIDDSESIKYLEQNTNAKEVVAELNGNKELSERFQIMNYAFGKELREFSTINDTLSFELQQSNISNALSQFSEIYQERTGPVILLTDGNQTFGSDYSYNSKKDKQPVFPIVLGDSVTYSDLSIKQLNSNRYAFLKNRFPVEVIVNYSGDEPVNSELTIRSGSSILFRKGLQFSSSKTSEIVNTSLLASSIGVKTYQVEIAPLQNEKNKVNNVKNFGVEVIDQKSNVAIVSDQIHPDLGAFKKAIESNEQRSATILKPSDYISKYASFQLVILYQPNSNFKEVYELIDKDKLNSFTVTGSTTDWNFLNNIQDSFQQTISNQEENYQPILNTSYGSFIIDTISFEDFPPVSSEFGDFQINGAHEVILYKSVNGINTGVSLLATFEANGVKRAVLNGENLWKWRAQSYLNTSSFESFDTFMGKLVQYLSSNKRRQRINLDYKSFYNGNDNLIITAQYFNKNFEFDPNASLSIQLKNSEDGTIQEFPLLFNATNYNVDLSGIPAGTYDFKIKHNNEAISISGSFKVLEFNVEQQFLNANIDKLSVLADRSEGKLFYTNETENLINNLLADSRFKTIQKSTKNIVPLIDWKYLLAIIALSLFLEWFIRKYNGLI